MPVLLKILFVAAVVLGTKMLIDRDIERHS
jgi:hypothetical protein